jgi:acetate kinase
MDRGILVLNSGSSSLKFALYREENDSLVLVSHGEIEAMMTAPKFAAQGADGAAPGAFAWSAPIDAETGFRYVLDWVGKAFPDLDVVAAGHRLVQGGDRFHGPALVDDEALAYLDGLSMLEPQHQPPEVEGIRALKRVHPTLPQVAVFDTSFHRSMPEVAQLYAVPKSVRDEGVRHSFGTRACATGATTARPTTTSTVRCRSTIRTPGG